MLLTTWQLVFFTSTWYLASFLNCCSFILWSAFVAMIGLLHYKLNDRFLFVIFKCYMTIYFLICLLFSDSKFCSTLTFLILLRRCQILYLGFMVECVEFSWCNSMKRFGKEEDRTRITVAFQDLSLRTSVLCCKWHQLLSSDRAPLRSLLWGYTSFTSLNQTEPRRASSCPGLSSSLIV